MKLKSFSDCLKSTSGKRHLLLGNGFSRACRDQVFSYDSLFDSADFGKLSPHAKKAFDALKTTDFEYVMNHLKVSAQLIRLYSKKSTGIADEMEGDAESLRKVLVEAIAGNHPALPSSIQDEEYAKCLKFLAPFEKIYSLNYDLLLYWTLMKGKENDNARDDGFRDPYDGDPENYVQEGYVEWSNSTHSQNIHYLHGSLHIFYKGGSLQKYCWSRTGVKLLEQVDGALKAGLFPLIVAEGTTDQKFERIQRSNYLGHNFRSFGKITGSLFLYGHAMSPNDQHILKQINKNNSLKQIFVSIYGDPSSPDNKRIISAANGLALHRPKTKNLEVVFFEAGTANVWK